MDVELGTIAIDSIYTPVKNVKFSIENYRVEQKQITKNLFSKLLQTGLSILKML